MPSTPKTRRAFMALSATATAATTVLPNAARAATAAPSSKVQALWQRYLVAYRRAQLAENAAEEFRNLFVAAYGDVMGTGLSGEALWGHDPRYPALGPLNEKATELSYRAVEAMDELMKCPSSSIADLRVKVAVVLNEWRQVSDLNEDEAQYDTLLALWLMQDAEAVLGPLELA
jgi:hypothetical protein